MYFAFSVNIIFQPYQSFETPSSIMGGDRHMRPWTFLYEIQLWTTFIWNFFGCDAYFWQCWAVNWMYSAVSGGLPKMLSYSRFQWGHIAVRRTEWLNLVNCINLELGWAQPHWEIRDRVGLGRASALSHHAPSWTERIFTFLISYLNFFLTFCNVVINHFLYDNHKTFVQGKSFINIVNKVWHKHFVKAFLYFYLNFP